MKFKTFVRFKLNFNIFQLFEYEKESTPENKR